MEHCPLLQSICHKGNNTNLTNVCFQYTECKSTLEISGIRCLKAFLKILLSTLAAILCI